MAWFEGSLRVPFWAVTAALNVEAGAALSAGALGINHGGTERWLGVLLLAIALALYLGAAKPAAASPAGAFKPHWWPPLRTAAGAVLALGAAVLTVVVLVSVVGPPVSYASGLDGQDPARTGCTGDGQRLGGSWPMHDATGGEIGVVELFQSVSCSTVWPRVVLTKAAVTKLVGQSLEISVTRPSDNVRNSISLLLRGDSRYGWSNMLGHSTCVEAQVRLETRGGNPAGPVTRTPCL